MWPFKKKRKHEVSFKSLEKSVEYGSNETIGSGLIKLREAIDEEYVSETFGDGHEFLGTFKGHGVTGSFVPMYITNYEYFDYHSGTFDPYKNSVGIDISKVDMIGEHIRKFICLYCGNSFLFDDRKVTSQIFSLSCPNCGGSI